MAKRCLAWLVPSLILNTWLTGGMYPANPITRWKKDRVDKNPTCWRFCKAGIHDGLRLNAQRTVRFMALCCTDSTSHVSFVVQSVCSRPGRYKRGINSESLERDPCTSRYAERAAPLNISMSSSDGGAASDSTLLGQYFISLLYLDS